MAKKVILGTESLTQIRDSLKELGVKFALIGGFAVSAQTQPRFTRDIDIVIVVRDDSEAESILHSLQTKRFLLGDVLEQTYTKRLAGVRLHRQGVRHVPIDLIFALSGVESEIVAGSQNLEVLPDVMLPVARLGHLIVLKLLSQGEDRLQDGVDLQNLAQDCSPTELEAARNLPL